MMSVMQQPTVFNSENHPTYKKDLEKVSKMMPVASYESIATMIPSDDDSSDTMSLMNEVMVEEPKKTTTTIEVALSPDYVKNVEKRDALVKRLGMGEQYKLEKLAKLQQKKVMMNDEISPGEAKWFNYDYDTEGLEEACKTTKRTEVVKKLGAGQTYKLHKLQKLEARYAPEVFAWDKWCHQDYDSADCLRQQ